MKPTQLLAVFFVVLHFFNCENPKAGAFLGAGDNQPTALVTIPGRYGC